MVTEKEFSRVQALLGRTSCPRAQKHSFSYTGLMACGGCNGTITAEEHTKPSGKHYIYYRCTRKHGPCSQPFTSHSVLEEQFRILLNQITISDQFRDWAIKHLRKTHTHEIKTRTAMFKNQQAAYNAIQKQLDKLMDMHLRELISQEEYQQKRHQLQKELASQKLKLTDTEKRADDWLELAERALIFANLAPKKFKNSTDDQKREIISALGSNFILKDKTITLNLQKPFTLLQKANTQNKQSRQTPRSFACGRPRETTFEHLLNQISQYFLTTNEYIHIPELKPI